MSELTPEPSVERLLGLAYADRGLPVTSRDLIWAVNRIMELEAQLNALEDVVFPDPEQGS
jgi:hypothetical protein